MLGSTTDEKADLGGLVRKNSKNFTQVRAIFLKGQLRHGIAWLHHVATVVILMKSLPLFGGGSWIRYTVISKKKNCDYSRAIKLRLFASLYKALRAIAKYREA